MANEGATELSRAPAIERPCYRGAKSQENEDFSLWEIPDGSGRIFPTMEAAKPDSSLRSNTPEMRPLAVVEVGVKVAALLARLPQSQLPVKSP